MILLVVDTQKAITNNELYQFELTELFRARDDNGSRDKKIRNYRTVQMLSNLIKLVKGLLWNLISIKIT